MNPAQLNHRINILYDVNATANPPITDDNGTPIENWQVYKPLWCRKEGMNGKGMRLPKLIYAANASKSIVNGMFQVRYREDITTCMRVQDGNNIYTIKDTPDVDGNREFMMIITEKVVNVGS